MNKTWANNHRKADDHHLEDDKELETATTLVDAKIVSSVSVSLSFCSLLMKCPRRRQLMMSFLAANNSYSIVSLFFFSYLSYLTDLPSSVCWLIKVASTNWNAVVAETSAKEINASLYLCKLIDFHYYFKSNRISSSTEQIVDDCGLPMIEAVAATAAEWRNYALAAKLITLCHWWAAAALKEKEKEVKWLWGRTLSISQFRTEE